MIHSLIILTALTFGQADKLPKAEITDKFGNPPPTEKLLGSTLILSANGSVNGGEDTSVVWLITPKHLQERSQQFWDRKLGPIFVVEIPYGEVEYTATITQIAILDNKSNVAEINVKCLKAPRPGPEPDPNPNPNPNPNPVPADTKFHISIIDSVRERTPQTALILNSDKYWNSLIEKGNSYIVYEKSTNERLLDGRIVNTIPYNGPKLIVYNKANNKLLLETKLPETLQGLMEVLNALYYKQ